MLFTSKVISLIDVLIRVQKEAKLHLKTMRVAPLIFTSSTIVLFIAALASAQIELDDYTMPTEVEYSPSEARSTGVASGVATSFELATPTCFSGAANGASSGLPDKVYLGFNNRTCSRAAEGGSANLVGPRLRR